MFLKKFQYDVPIMKQTVEETTRSLKMLVIVV